MHRRRFLTGTIGAAVAPSVTALASVEPLSRLGEWRTHAIMRHAIAPGTGDPAAFALGDCSTQRNLSNLGRAQAQRSGMMLREAGARIDQVWSSRWCRCLDTASLLDVGTVEEIPPLDSFFEDRDAGPVQTEALTGKLLGLDPGSTVIMVTHQVNVAGLIGEFARSGEIFVFRIAPSGETTTIGSVVAEA